MATSVDWPNKNIIVQQSDLLLVQSTPIATYDLDIDVLRLELKDLEDEVEGMPHDDTHIYTPPFTISGVTLSRVVEIINDYTISINPDTAYGVNIKGGNSNIADRITNTVTQIRTANSAGLQDLAELQVASFLGAVHIDITSGISGTAYPRGTPGFPVDNLADAKAISDNANIPIFRVLNSMTIATEDFSDGYTFTTNRYGVVLTIDTSANITNCSFEEIGVTGVLDDSNRFYRCEVVNATSLQALLTDCGLSGTLVLGGGLTQLINCHSNVAGGGPGQTPSIDLGATGNDLIVRDYSGGLSLENYSGSNDISIDLDSGRVIVASDVTAGDIFVRGLGEVTDNSTGTATVYDNTITELVTDTRRHLKNQKRLNRTTGQMEIWADDDSGVLYSGEAFEDYDGTIPVGPASTKVDRTDRID